MFCCRAHQCVLLDQASTLYVSLTGESKSNFALSVIEKDMFKVRQSERMVVDGCLILLK